MKKSILTIALFVASVCMIDASAQTKTSFGVKLNGNMTNVKLTDLQGSSSSFKPGVSVGGFAKIQFNENFALQPELLFSYTDTKVKLDDMKNKYKYASVEIPVYAVGQWALGNGKIFVGAGPNIGYGFSIDSKTEKLPEGHPGENKIELDHWYAGGGIMAGYEFDFGLIVNAGYKMGWDLSSTHKSSGVRTQTISVGVGYKF
ncbi:MAG: PorT family protein [Bacteroides sp.]|nr:PorT family protein [Bacteroides sp.]